MSADRELLELAAKAAAYEIEWGIVEGGKVFEPPTKAYLRDDYGFRWPWNPLEDDGDALRLAVKLAIDFYEGDDDGPAAYAGYFTGARQKFATVQHGDDPYAATRRAIVLAAAEIGKAIDGGKQ